jgi:hypothetical protein
VRLDRRPSKKLAHRTPLRRELGFDLFSRNEIARIRRIQADLHLFAKPQLIVRRVLLLPHEIAHEVAQQLRTGSSPRRSNRNLPMVLQSDRIVGIIANVKADLLIRFRDVLPDGSIIEAVIWHLPTQLMPSTHRYKYRLAYVANNERVIGFDNERGKGDHKHVGSAETPYSFKGVDQLINDFQNEVKKWNAAR